MRGLNLGALRGRVERLASDCAPRDPAVLLFSWQWNRDDCATCGYDLRGHAVAGAHQKAERGAGRFLWLDRPRVCPSCGSVVD